MSQLGDLGSGVGHGGGGGGAIREAGGAFGRLEAAREEEFFYKKVRVIRSMHPTLFILTCCPFPLSAVQGAVAPLEGAPDRPAALA